MPLLAHLKTQTTDCHAALEKTMDVFAHVQTIGDYTALLSRFLGLHEPLEDHLARAVDWPSRGWNFEARRRAPWLRADLEALALSAEEIQKSPRCRELPALTSVGAAVGCLYVLEGSALGGQMIARHFQAKLGLTSERGLRFFTGFGEATVSQWRAFGQWAETETEAAKSDPTFPPAAVAAARETFDCFARWMPQ